jgi:hypothetical protein
MHIGKLVVSLGALTLSSVALAQTPSVAAVAAAPEISPASAAAALALLLGSIVVLRGRRAK